jgi:hypothetical protein
MQIGSIVELINDNWGSSYIQGVTYPIKGKEYTVRGFTKNRDGDVFLLLEEIVNSPRIFHEGYIEPAFYVHRFKEKLMSYSDMEEYINQNSLEYA